MTPRTHPARRPAALVLAAALTLAVAACSDDETPSTPTGTATATDGSQDGADPADPTDEATDAPSEGALDPRDPVVETVTATLGTPLATGLQAPWGLAQLPDGDWLVTERDTRAVKVVPADASAPTTLTGPGADDLVEGTTGTGEGGLLGVALSPTFADDNLVFFYRTAEEGNEVLSGTLDGTTLGELTAVLSGIPAAATHDGGRIAFGPDGMLYVATGDSGSTILAQHPDSLGGKILRIAPDGSVPRDNPVPGSPVWSLGHRNVQGLGWAQDGRMLASELGQDNLDELNLVVSGGNYGWPAVEGPGGTSQGFVDPLVSWSTDAASPSGLAVTDEGVYVAALQGEALLRVPLAPDGVGDPQTLLAGELGRLRAVAVGADGDLYVLTSNTDGRGELREGDDRLVPVVVTED